MQNIAKQVHVLHIYYHNRSTMGQYLQLYFKNRVIQYNCIYICVNSTNNKNNNNTRKEGNKTVRLMNYKSVNKVINHKTIVHADTSPF